MSRTISHPRLAASGLLILATGVFLAGCGDDGRGQDPDPQTEREHGRDEGRADVRARTAEDHCIPSCPGYRYHQSCGCNRETERVAVWEARLYRRLERAGDPRAERAEATPAWLHGQCERPSRKSSDTAEAVDTRSDCEISRAGNHWSLECSDCRVQLLGRSTGGP